MEIYKEAKHFTDNVLLPNFVLLEKFLKREEKNK